jgi:hypothetical protein
MIPGRDNDSHTIDYFDKNMANSNLMSNDSDQPEKNTQVNMPSIGDVYKKRGGDHPLQTMVVAINGDTIFLGNNLELSLNELNDNEIWEFQYSLLED